MKYPVHTTAVAIAGAKDAALYFDYVIPVGVPSLGSLPEVRHGKLVAEASLDDVPDVSELRELLPPELRGAKPYELVNGLSMYAIAMQEQLRGGWAAALVNPSLAENVARAAASSDDDFLRGVCGEVVRWTRYLHEANALGHLAFFTGRSPDAEEESPSLTLSALQLVDTTETTWAQISELREDTTRTQQLRNLRLAIFEDYAGKPRGYIRDALEKRIEEYQSAAKFWGLPLKEKMLTVVSNERTTAATMLSTMIAMLTGQSVADVALIGGAFMIGKVALEFAKRKHSIQALSQTNAVAYLVRTRRLVRGGE